MLTQRQQLERLTQNKEQSKGEVPGTETQTIVSSQDLDEMDDEVKQLRAENTRLIEVSNHIKAQYDALLLTEDSFVRRYCTILD